MAREPDGIAIDHQAAVQAGRVPARAPGVAGVLERAARGTDVPVAADAAADHLAALLPNLRPATLAALRQVAVSRVADAGDLLVRQGEPVELVIALDGLISVRSTSTDGHCFTLCLMTSGQVMGIGSAWHPTTSMFDLVALTPVRVMILPGMPVRRLALDDPALGMALFDVAAGMVTLMAQRLEQSTFDSVRTQLATVLLAYEPLIAEPASLISRDELASLVGASREMLRHVLRDFEARGIVQRRGRSILIRDRNALRAAAKWDSGGSTHAHWLQFHSD